MQGKPPRGNSLPHQQNKAERGQAAKDVIQNHRPFLNTKLRTRKHGIRSMKSEKHVKRNLPLSPLRRSEEITTPHAHRLHAPVVAGWLAGLAFLEERRVAIIEILQL